MFYLFHANFKGFLHSAVLAISSCFDVNWTVAIVCTFELLKFQMIIFNLNFIKNIFIYSLYACVRNAEKNFGTIHMKFL